MKNMLVGLLFFLGFSALFGGICLIISPTGQLIGHIPLSILKDSPFKNFLIPGIILFVVLGLTPTLVALALINKTPSALAEKFNFFFDMYWGWTFSIYIAFALIIWIQVETIYFQSVIWLQTFYLFYSIPLIIVTLHPSVRGYYKK
jgi:hypothetical protein